MRTAAIVAGLAFGALLCRAQTFEVASVKIATPQGPGPMLPSMRGGPGTGDPAQISYTNVLMRTLLLKAFGAKAYELVAPQWVGTERYNIVAKVPEGATKETFNVMLQNLLRERFHLAMHREDRELPVYALVLLNGGHKLKPSNGDADAPTPVTTLVPNTSTAVPATPTSSASGDLPPISPAMLKQPPIALLLRGKARIVGHGTMQVLAELLSGVGDRPVLDRTGDAGDYEFDLHWGVDTADSAEPDLFRAIQNQFGLKLESRKEHISMLAIDSLDKTPIEN